MEALDTNSDSKLRDEVLRKLVGIEMSALLLKASFLKSQFDCARHQMHNGQRVQLEW